MLQRENESSADSRTHNAGNPIKLYWGVPGEILDAHGRSQIFTADGEHQLVSSRLLPLNILIRSSIIAMKVQNLRMFGEMIHGGSRVDSKMGIAIDLPCG